MTEQRGGRSGRPRAVALSDEHDETEARYAEGDAAAWERPLRESELFFPDRRDMFNFIDETKVRYLRPLLPPGGRALEVGAGSGRLLIRLGRERPYRLVALDYAPYAMRAVRENYRRAGATGSVLFGDARGLPFPDRSFDLVLSGGLLEHFRDPAPVLREMARVLRPGGLCYADIVPRKVSLYRWAALAREAGLRDVRIVAAGVYPPYTLPGHERLVWKYRSLVRALDGTPVADLLGFFYLLTGTRA